MTDLPLGHEYWGNVCSGFGAPLECRHILESGQKCGKSPFEHHHPQYLITELTFRKEMDIQYKKCQYCGNNIETMCFLGTGVCSENCRKDIERQTELVEARSIYSGVTVSKEEVTGWKP